MTDGKRFVNRSFVYVSSVVPFYELCAPNAVITITIRLRYDYEPITTYRARLLPFDATRREPKMNMSVCRRSRVVVVSQSNRNCDIGLNPNTLKSCCTPSPWGDRQRRISEVSN